MAARKATENPIQRLIDKPKLERDEAVFLESGEAARLLAAAKEMDGRGRGLAVPFRYPLLATYLYTGGRPEEVLGLEVEDIDFERGVVIFRRNQWRDLKRRWSRRTVPLWPDRLDTAVRKAKIEKRVTPKTFRHTYTAVRLQTTDNGKPVSVWQVACELGHGDTNLIERTYGHLLGVRDRSTVVRYGEAKVLPHRRTRPA